MILRKFWPGFKVVYCLILLLFILMCLNTGVLLGAGKEATVEVTIIPNALDISIATPVKVTVDKRFTIKATINNLGEEKIQGVTATIYLDEESLYLIGGIPEGNIGALSPHKERTIRWVINPTKPGNYVVIVSARGVSEFGEVSSSDSAIIKVEL